MHFFQSQTILKNINNIFQKNQYFEQNGNFVNLEHILEQEKN